MKYIEFTIMRNVADAIVYEMTIGKAKRRARYHYNRYMDIFDNVDCGHSMLQLISRRASRHAACFNTAMDQLCELDPKCKVEFRL